MLEVNEGPFLDNYIFIIILLLLLLLYKVLYKSFCCSKCQEGKKNSCVLLERPFGTDSQWKFNLSVLEGDVIA